MAEINIGEITEALNNKLDLDLNNIGDSNSFDAEWVVIDWIELYNGPTNADGIVIDLTDVIPQDDCTYELRLEFNVSKGSAVGSAGIKNENGKYLFTFSSNTTIATKGHIAVPAKNSLTLIRYSGTDFTFSIGLRGYKRLGKKGA